MRTTAGLLRAQRLHGSTDRARVALVGQTALLLGGDQVGVEVEVGPGAVLELTDIAATVAYHGRGRSAHWQTTVRLGLGARLSYAGAPLVVSDGADVTRSLTVDLAEGASAWLRETVVLGRAGEVGGRLDTSAVLRRSGEEFCRERLILDPRTRGRPGMLAGVRVLDSVLVLGTRARSRSDTVRGSFRVPDLLLGALGRGHVCAPGRRQHDHPVPRQQPRRLPAGLTDNRQGPLTHSSQHSRTSYHDVRE